MARGVDVTVDRDACVGCGECVRMCPTRALGMVGGKAAVVGDHSLGCGHCVDVCPVGAVTLGSLDPRTRAYATMTVPEGFLGAGGVEPGTLVQLMSSRRSCRAYTDEPVGRDVLEDLVRVGLTAPSGTNSQKWTFTVLPERKAMVALAERILAFFVRLNRIAGIAPLRWFLRMVGKPELDVYHRRYASMIEAAVSAWRNEKRDLLWHGAPAAIIIAARPGGGTSPEDCLLAAQNILLAAHAMGLGTCLIGFAVSAMKRDASLARSVGIGADETVHAIVALGHPAVIWHRGVPGRRWPEVRFVE